MRCFEAEAELHGLRVFKPHTDGKQSAQLMVQNDNGYVLAHVDMTGVGFPKKEAPPLTVRVSPEVVDFGEHKVGSLSALQNFSMQRVRAPRPFEARVSFSAADGMAFDFNTHCAVLLPEQSCTDIDPIQAPCCRQGDRRDSRCGTAMDKCWRTLTWPASASLGLLLLKPIRNLKTKRSSQPRLRGLESIVRWWISNRRKLVRQVSHNRFSVQYKHGEFRGRLRSQRRQE